MRRAAIKFYSKFLNKCEFSFLMDRLSRVRSFVHIETLVMYVYRKTC